MNFTAKLKIENIIRYDFQREIFTFCSESAFIDVHVYNEAFMGTNLNNKMRAC